jgi:hypothetical protein
MFVRPGKIEYVKTASLDIEISAGVMFDYTEWIPAAQHHEYFADQIPLYYDQLCVKILLDDVVLLDRIIGNDVIKFHHDFLDSETEAEHTLQIVLTGLQSEFNHFYKEKDVFVLVRIDDVFIEQLPMQYILEQLGEFQRQDADTISPSQYMGYNGQYVLKFKTPIYSWLLEHDALIKSNF